MEQSQGDIAFLVLGGALIFGAVLAFGIYSYRSRYRRAEELLAQWATQNGFEVVDKQEANPPGTGPKSRYASDKRVMYRATLRDARGQRRQALVRLGDKHVGTLKDDVTVDWDP